MPDSTNTHLADVQYLGDDGTGGTSLGTSSTSKVSKYGVTPVAQASAIPDVAGTVSLTTSINAILAVLRNGGDIAA